MEQLHTIRDASQQVIDRIKYPSLTGNALRSPGNASVYASGTAMGLSVASNVLKHANAIDHDQKQLLSRASKGLFAVGAGGAIAVGGAIFEVVLNEQAFGNFMTVNKVAVFPGYFGLQFPEIEGERFVGELHFVGSGDENPFQGKHPTEIIREGLRGLYRVADACERSKVSVQDFQYFVGCSNIVTRGLQQFGFNVKPYELENSHQLSNRLNAADPLTHRVLFDKSIPYSNRTDAMVCMINRQDLIANKRNLARAAHLWYR
jgi:hypothetical protein